jgi:hypothetical protein
MSVWRDLLFAGAGALGALGYSWHRNRRKHDSDTRELLNSLSEDDRRTVAIVRGTASVTKEIGKYEKRWLPPRVLAAEAALDVCARCVQDIVERSIDNRAAAQSAPSEGIIDFEAVRHG